ncbi:uncharacterized protein F5891DRAFT_1183802 [Suillus fuscotomentosus]|uniref:Uncharacterized protein n=1 Tax=Suillus fuscotomentosus TaxID=1912939 RepID=A0AAD4HQR1_9AGAM|nr:uncharacterized protein F5891DRAFT_1183802 [Suillus fuscotomentosus]KAG1905096.1 hypothetical protein F5891DRAFT_1183802 [Suillus fuscotomentosus]
MATDDHTAVPQATFNVFSPAMDNLYGGTRPPADRNRGYVKNNQFLQLSGGFFGYMPPSSPEEDQSHPTTSAAGGPAPIAVNPSPPGSESHASVPIPSSDAGLPPSTSFESRAATRGKRTMVESEVLESVLGSLEFTEESHCDDSEDLQYNKLLEEIIQWV